MPEAVVRENVRRMMHRLEPLRRQYGAAFEITSGYRDPARDVGAGDSQHKYGTGVDFVLPTADGGRKVQDNRQIRDRAKLAGWHAIFCYADKPHNHLDIRSNNDDDQDPGVEPLIDPERDDQGRDLDTSESDGSPATGPCEGESG